MSVLCIVQKHLQRGVKDNNNKSMGKLNKDKFWRHFEKKNYFLLKCTSIIRLRARTNVLQGLKVTALYDML